MLPDVRVICRAKSDNPGRIETSREQQDRHVDVLTIAASPPPAT